MRNRREFLKLAGLAICCPNNILLSSPETIVFDAKLVAISFMNMTAAANAVGQALQKITESARNFQRLAKRLKNR